MSLIHRVPVKQTVLSCLVLAVSISCLAAEGRVVSFRSLCVEFAGDLQAVVIPGKDPKESQKVQLYTDISEVNEGTFQNSDAEIFVEKGTGPDGKPLRELIAKAPLGKSNRQLFVFVPTGQKAEGTLPYKLTCYDDDLKALPMGNVRAINLAPVPVRFILAGQTTPQIPPSKYAQFPHSTKVNDYDMYPVVVEFLSANGDWVKGQSVSWKSTDRRREIVITLVDPTYKQPNVRMYSDVPPWLNEAAPASR